MSKNIVNSSEFHGSIYKDSTVLITGGTGSVGLELTRVLLGCSPQQIRLLSNDENGLFEARSLFSGHHEVTYHLGDVRDVRSIEAVIKDCDYVFHAAALKHVTFCEENPYEAITTNILGTQNIIDHAIKNEVQRFVLISTDKAVNPMNVMGATKLLAERLVINAGKLTNKPVFSVVRFGNVLGSRGSVIIIFERQVRNGSPITITDPNMTRFITLPSDAARRVLHATEVAKPGDVFTLKMKAIRIGDLATACRKFFAKSYNRNAEEIKTVIIGSNPKEKMHEELMTSVEAINAVEKDDFYVFNEKEYIEKSESAANSLSYSTKMYVSESAPLVSEEEAISMLSRLYSQGSNVNII